MIYICTHTDFDLPDRVRDGYSILSIKPLERDYPIPVSLVQENAITPMQYAYAEGYHIRHLWEHDNGDEWIGINGYRKYFFDIPCNRTILPIARKYNMHEQFADAHNINDLLECERIIDEKFPRYKCDYESLQLYHCNMFVMRRADFWNYCSFVFGVLDEFNKRHGLQTDEDVRKYVESTKGQWTKHDAKYQSRLQGYLFERIGTIFFNTYFGIVHKKIHFVANKI